MVDGKRKALMFKQGLIGANDGAGGWQDEPVLLSHAHGTNSYDRTTKMISVVIRGDRPLKIVQMPVVSVGMSLAVSESEVCVCPPPPRCVPSCSLANTVVLNVLIVLTLSLSYSVSSSGPWRRPSFPASLPCWAFLPAALW